MSNPTGDGKKPHLSPEQMQALVAPASDLMAKLLQKGASKQELQAALDRFGDSGMVKYLRDEIIGSNFERWARENNIELPTAPPPGNDDAIKP